MVGLPYPNLHSPELKEKMSFLNRTVAPDKEGKQAGQVPIDVLLLILVKSFDPVSISALRHISRKGFEKSSRAPPYSKSTDTAFSLLKMGVDLFIIYQFYVNFWTGSEIQLRFQVIRKLDP